MEAIVNNKYRYIMFFSPKAGCSSIRTLFLALHNEEMNDKQKSELNSYHNLSEIFPYNRRSDYSDYFTFIITRNPYSRIVSAFLDQYVYQQHSSVADMFLDHPPSERTPNTFNQLLSYIQNIPDSSRDSHFQTQTHFFHDNYTGIKKLLFGRSERANNLDFIADISTFNDSMKKIYEKIFKNDPVMNQRAIHEIENITKLNSLIYSDNVPDNIADLSLDELRALPFAPLPQHFFNSDKTKKVVSEIYAEDFNNFNYSRSEIPIKNSSPELKKLPTDFDWETYLSLNPDLEAHGLTTKREAIKHYLQIGIHETRRY